MRISVISVLFIGIFCLGLNAQNKDSKIYHFSVKEGQLSPWLKPGSISKPIISAHRGGRNIPGYPENALETFEYISQTLPSMIECDISMTMDSVLVLLHDRSLDRTTTGTGNIISKPISYVRELQLIDDLGDTTDFKVPTLEDALTWAKGKSLIELDVKRGVPFELVTKAVEAAQMEDYVIIITYNIKDAQKVYQLNPKLMISIGARNQEELQRVLESGIPTKNLIAFTGTRLSEASLFEAIHQNGMLTILGTLGNLDKQAAARGDEKTYKGFLELGVDVLATDRPIEAAQAIGLLPYPEEENSFYKVELKNK